MRRPVTAGEMKEIFTTPPWNHIPEYFIHPDGIVHFEMDPQTFPALAFNFRNNLIINDANQPISPLDGIACPELARFLRLPSDEINGQTKLLFGSIDPTATYPIFDMTSDSSQWTHMLAVERYTGITVRDRQNWHKVAITHVSPIWKANSQSDENNNYWSFTLYPIGYCRLERIGKKDFKILDHSGTAHFGTYDELLPHINATTRWLIRAAINDLEQYYNLRGRNSEIQQLCHKYSQELQQIQQIAGFEDLSTDVQPCTHGTFDFKIGEDQYKQSQLVDYIANLQREAGYYQRFRPAFECLRERIETAYGRLNTSCTYYAEVKFQIHSGGSQDPGRETRRFRYSEPGVADCIAWIAEQENIIQKAQQVMQDNLIKVS